MKTPLLVLSALLLGTAPAWAVLGESVDSVRSDQVHLRGQLLAVSRLDYTIHQISAPDGTVVREYVSTEGRVFGVSWQGPTIPNLAQLLGSHFAEFQQASQSSAHRRRAVAVRTDRLVVESGGHPRAFHGRAYLPGFLPNSISEAAVR
jgi:hypothetical protein